MNLSRNSTQGTRYPLSASLLAAAVPPRSTEVSGNPDGNVGLRRKEVT